MKRLVLVLALTIVATSVGMLPARANGTVGNFEIDGDRVDQSDPSNNIDWNTPPPNMTPFTDLTKSKNDDSYGQGSKELEPGAWVCTKGGVPSKDDIRKGAIAFRTIAGKQYAYVNWERLDVNGDAHIDYEFNQSSAGTAACPDAPARTNGDLLLSFDTDQGGKFVFFRAYFWTFTGSGIGTFTELPLGSEGTTFDAAVNIAPSLSDPGLKPGQFGEASVNLTDTIGSIPCGRFAGIYMKSRSSTSLNSALKDRTSAVPFNPGNCETNPSISKSAGSSSVAVGENVTFTIGYGNAGPGPAPTATISDPIPAGTGFAGCTTNGSPGGCTVGGGVVTWNVGPVPAGGSGSVTVTLTVLSLPASCQICNTATITMVNQASAAPPAQACVAVHDTPNPAGANANGSAFGARVSGDGLATTTHSFASSSQAGVGSNDAAESTTIITGPPLWAEATRTSSVSVVTAAPADAAQTSVAEAVNVDVAGGVVTASLVRAVAVTHATAFGSSVSAIGSEFVGLKVDPDGAAGPSPAVAYGQVAPNTTIDISAAFGSGSFVKLFAQNGAGATGVPVAAKSGSKYVADLSVTMIHVYLRDRDPITPGPQKTDVFVSRAIAHSDFPALAGCGSAPQQSVSGHAYVAKAVITDLVADTVVVTHGAVAIPASGGHDHQDLVSVAIGDPGNELVTADVADTDSMGTIGAASDATSYARGTGVCVLRSGAACVISATAVTSKARSLAAGGPASSEDTGTQLLGVNLLGAPISPARNETHTLAGLGYVVFNEQTCAFGASLSSCTNAGSTGLTVASIHVVITVPGNALGLTPGTEIIVSLAHSGASYV